MNACRKEKSPYAQVAARIKAYCREMGVPCSATSESYAGGNSVRVHIHDQPPAVFAKIKEYADQFQMGQFDGMTDMYEYSNHRRDLPQAKYVFVDNDYSDEIRQAAWNVIRERYGDAAGAPAIYAEAGNFRMGDCWATDFVYRFLRGSLSLGGDSDPSAEFWKSRMTPAPSATIAPTTGAASIEEHTHTKGGFQMWLVILAERVDGEAFAHYLDQAKALGGWYSRKWGTTPAGFAFKDQAKAAEFAATIGPHEPTDPDGTKEPGAADIAAVQKAAGDHAKAERLRALADGMQGKIDSCFADRLANTPKRQRQAGDARNEGERLKRTQQGLRALADHHEAGTVPPVLATVTTKAAAYELAAAEMDRSRCGYYDVPIDLGRPSKQTPSALAFWKLLTPKSDEERKAGELREMMAKLQFANIPGFFQTPAALVARMIEAADIQPGHVCLEPEAGAGAIADQIKAAGADVDCCEVCLSLRRILEAKSHRMVADDFMAATLPQYDRVVMNPPFELRQDIDHVRKAFDHLKPGGRLVAIMSPGPFFRSDAKCTAFREWFNSLGGEREDIPAGTFKESGTGVSSVLVIIDKP